MFQQFIETLFPWLSQEEEKEELYTLALDAETKVRELNGLPPETNNTSKDSLKSILKTTCLLLERLIERRNPSSTASWTQDSPSSPTKVSNSSPQVVSSEEETALEIPPVVPPEQATTDIPELKIAVEEQPSVTAKELIALRDWILLANSGNKPPSPEVFNQVYRKLGQILKHENIIPLEETDIYNDQKQLVIDTKSTDDPEKDNLVFSTVRPGYQFQGRLIRPQEVLVYVFEPQS